MPAALPFSLDYDVLRFKHCTNNPTGIFQSATPNLRAKIELLQSIYKSKNFLLLFQCDFSPIFSFSLQQSISLLACYITTHLMMIICLEIQRKMVVFAVLLCALESTVVACDILALLVFGVWFCGVRLLMCTIFCLSPHARPILLACCSILVKTVASCVNDRSHVDTNKCHYVVKTCLLTVVFSS